MVIFGGSGHENLTPVQPGGKRESSSLTNSWYLILEPLQAPQRSHLLPSNLQGYPWSPALVVISADSPRVLLQMLLYRSGVHCLSLAPRP